jgi:hypothetical protein
MPTDVLVVLVGELEIDEVDSFSQKPVLPSRLSHSFGRMLPLLP